VRNASPSYAQNTKIYLKYFEVFKIYSTASFQTSSADLDQLPSSISSRIFINIFDYQFQSD